MNRNLFVIVLGGGGVKAFCVKSFKGRVRRDSPKVEPAPTLAPSPV
jgi:hypothetical protein